tara:strand:+ start:110 stop:298 length:189 start_codon:yes stop_codon:yes gene_type:complete
MPNNNKPQFQIVSSKILYGMVALNAAMFVFSFSIANREMMLLNLLSGLMCYVGAKINAESKK